MRPGRIVFSMAGVTIETSIGQLKEIVAESLRGKRLTDSQWGWLARLSSDGRLDYDKQFYDELRPLRARKEIT
jgi:hypothetical protein